jgi:hypothetical protein
MAAVTWHESALRLMKGRARVLPWLVGDTVGRLVLVLHLRLGVEVTSLCKLLVDSLLQMIFSISSFALEVLTDIVAMARSGDSDLGRWSADMLHRWQFIFFILVFWYFSKS